LAFGSVLGMFKINLSTRELHQAVQLAAPFRERKIVQLSQLRELRPILAAGLLSPGRWDVNRAEIRISAVGAENFIFSGRS
jgi:hypothetical protein